MEYVYVVKTTQSNVPKNIQEAMKMSDADLWCKEAMTEIKSLHDLNIYKLVLRSTVRPGQNVISTNCVFKVKENQTYKARLVARGWNQVPGQDCGSTFAPVCRLPSVRMVLAIAAEMDWEVRQLDVNTPFLYSDIEKEVFVAEPPGFETNDNEKVLLVTKLGNSVYGPAQSPGNWFHTIDPVLIPIGFVPLKSDTCIYVCLLYTSPSPRD